MTATLTPFDFTGQQVRVVVDEHGEPQFVVADVARILGYRDAANAARLVESDERGYSDVSTPGGTQTVLTVNESGLYALVFRSNRPDAITFRRWITGEVLPAIRKTGSYGTPALPDITTPAGVLAMAEQFAETARALVASQEEVAALAPRAEVGDRLMNADGDLSVADAGKALTRAGVKVGERRLFSLLAGLRWVYRHPGDGRWRVYQAAIESGWMSVLPMSHYHPKTGVLVLDPPQPRVTPKGLQRILRDQGADVLTSVAIMGELAASA